MLDELTELAHLWVAPDAPPTSLLFRAALEDLGYIRRLLGHLASEPERTQLTVEEIERCRLAGRLSERLGRLLEPVVPNGGPSGV